jgi:hypothetical protein
MYIIKSLLDQEINEKNMKKFAIAAGLLLLASPVFAAVTVGAQPASLVTTPVTVGSSSAPLALFSFTLSADAAETLSYVVVTLNPVAGSSVTGSHAAQLAVYRDANGNGIFDPAADLAAGTQSTVTVGTPTTITTSANNSLATSTKFFVTLATAASWTGVAPADSLTATLGATAISTSVNSPTVTPVTTSTITATAPVAIGPVLNKATLQTSGGTKIVTLAFNAATNKPTLSSSNINSVLMLSGSHSWLDGAGAIGSATWNAEGKVLTVALSSTIASPTVAAGDVVTISGSVIKDATATSSATGTATLANANANRDHDDEDQQGDHQNQNGENNNNDDDDEGQGVSCASTTLVNGHLYKVADSATVYLADHCVLKPFRGEAVFHTRGNKFNNITVLAPISTTAVSADPALPASGTLVKGSEKTVWFVGSGHKRKGFASAEAFLGLGFNFRQVNQIADTDLMIMPLDATPITSPTTHPNGALVRCADSATILQVKGNQGTAFSSEDAFTLRGHTFKQVATIDCGKFHYVLAKVLTK